MRGDTCTQPADRRVADHDRCIALRLDDGDFERQAFGCGLLMQGHVARANTECQRSAAGVYRTQVARLFFGEWQVCATLRQALGGLVRMAGRTKGW